MSSNANGATDEPPPAYPADLRAARVQLYLEQLDKTLAACANAVALLNAGIDGDLEMIKAGMPGWRFPDHTTGLASAARTQRLTMMLAVRLMDPPRATPRDEDRDPDETEPPDRPSGPRPPPDPLELPDILEPLERERPDFGRPDFGRPDREAGDPDEARQFAAAIRDIPIPDVIAALEDRLAPKPPPPRRRRLPPRNRPHRPAWNYFPGYNPPLLGSNSSKARTPAPPPSG